MEYKHFSHKHGLIFHQLPQGTELQCSGCKSPGSGSVYACWQCNYFLHDHCYRATRSLKHPSHPMHPLTLVPYPTYPSNSFYCNTCNLIGSGFSYCCSECEFDLHIHCAHETLSHVPYPNYSNVPHGTHSFNPHPAFDGTQSFNPQPAFQMPPTYATAGYNNTQNNPSLNLPPNYATSPQPASYESVQHNVSPNLPPNNVTLPNFNPPSLMNLQAPSSAQGVHVPLASNQPKPQDASVPVPPPSQPVQIALLSNPLKKQEIKHFSHPHALYLQEIKENAAKVCSGCEDDLSGSVYSCIDSQCNFNLHKSCFELPREIRHKSHLEHPLTLLAKPPSNYTDGKFACNACIQDGAAFVYNCSTCSFDLHIECVSLPESIRRPDHKHPLNLFYSNPVPKAEGQQQEVTFVCDVCRNPVHEMAWTYYCHECDFGTHLECAAFEVQPAEQSEAELIREAEMKLAVLQLLLNGGRDAAGAVKETKLKSAVKKCK